MINIIIWLAALLCPNPNHTVENHGSCTLMHAPTVTTNGNETGGELGGIPKPPTPPPPPPPGTGG